jgi:GTP-binding protein Era
VPYACEVVVSEYKEVENMDRIRAEIIVERESQKAILIGRKGSALKKVGAEARKDIEAMAGKKVFLELFVKVKAGWRDNEQMLRGFGYR